MTLTVPTEVTELVRRMLGGDHGQLPDAALGIEVAEALSQAADDPAMTPMVLGVLVTMAHAAIVAIMQTTGYDYATALWVLETVATRTLEGSTAP